MSRFGEFAGAPSRARLGRVLFVLAVLAMAGFAGRLFPLETPAWAADEDEDAGPSQSLSDFQTSDRIQADFDSAMEFDQTNVDDWEKWLNWRAFRELSLPSPSGSAESADLKRIRATTRERMEKIKAGALALRLDHMQMSSAALKARDAKGGPAPARREAWVKFVRDYNDAEVGPLKAEEQALLGEARERIKALEGKAAPPAAPARRTR